VEALALHVGDDPLFVPADQVEARRNGFVHRLEGSLAERVATVAIVGPAVAGRATLLESVAALLGGIVRGDDRSPSLNRLEVQTLGAAKELSFRNFSGNHYHAWVEYCRDEAPTCDILVLVFDSQRERMEANGECLDAVRMSTALTRKRGLVLYTKRDTPTAEPVEVLNDVLNPMAWPWHANHPASPATATWIVATIERLLRPKEVLFYAVADEFGAFSNFAPYPVRIDGKRWPTTEHYFQSQKFLDPSVRERVRSAKTPAEAARLGRSRKLKLRSDWDSSRVGVMRVALLAKFQQHPDLAALLVGTGDARIVEHTTNDDFWGDGGDGSGSNILGTLLMEIRAVIQRPLRTEDHRRRPALVSAPTQGERHAASPPEPVRSGGSRRPQ
jgi:N-glycosidase YbiA